MRPFSVLTENSMLADSDALLLKVLGLAVCSQALLPEGSDQCPPQVCSPSALTEDINMLGVSDALLRKGGGKAVCSVALRLEGSD